MKFTLLLPHITIFIVRLSLLLLSTKEGTIYFLLPNVNRSLSTTRRRRRRRVGMQFRNFLRFTPFSHDWWPAELNADTLPAATETGGASTSSVLHRCVLCFSNLFEVYYLFNNMFCK